MIIMYRDSVIRELQQDMATLRNPINIKEENSNSYRINHLISYL